MAMSEIVGRAGFHLQHTKSPGERGAILDEMMRELDPASIERWAKRNPNIVVEDERYNQAFAHDDSGRLVRCTDRSKVIAYGEERLSRLSSPLRASTVTTSMFVLHLPKTMCREVPDFYPVYDSDGKEVARRSRWVAKDRDEAFRYFNDAIAYLNRHVIPGGKDAILGIDMQHSESTPHVQILADTLAPDPKHPGKLRCDYSRAYGSHRDVRDESGKQISGQAKMRDYHAGLKGWMLSRGWEIEAEVDPLRHDKTATKETYGKMLDKERALAAESEEIDFTRGRAARLISDADSRQAQVREAEAALATREAELTAGEQALAAAKAAWQVQKSQEEADLAEQRKKLQGDRQKLTSDREFLDRQKQSWLSEKSAQEDKLERRHYAILADDATVREHAGRLAARVGSVQESLVTIGLYVRDGASSPAQARDAITRLFAYDGDVTAACQALDAYKSVEQTLAARAAQRPTPTKRPAWKAYLDDIDVPDMERVDDDFELGF